MSGPILFPRILFGDREATRREWRKVARAAWKQGDWSCLASLEMADAVEMPGDILLQRGMFGSGSRGREVLWRPYWASKSISLLNQHIFASDSARRAFDLIFEGMRENPWFAIGMLECETADVPAREFDADTKSPFRAFFRRMLDGFVNWLPEISRLCDRYTTETYTAAAYSRQFPLAWASNIVGSAECSGFEFSPRVVTEIAQRLNSVDGDDFADWLVESGIVERQGSRFRVREPSE